MSQLGSGEYVSTHTDKQTDRMLTWCSFGAVTRYIYVPNLKDGGSFVWKVTKFWRHRSIVWRNRLRSLLISEARKSPTGHAKLLTYIHICQSSELKSLYTFFTSRKGNTGIFSRGLLVKFSLLHARIARFYISCNIWQSQSLQIVLTAFYNSVCAHVWAWHLSLPMRTSTHIQ